jgi:hypothetical protein
MGIQAHTYIRLLLDHGSDSSRMTITGIGQYQFVGLKAKTPKPLCAIWALGRGEIETIALQGWQAKTVVNSPLASRLAGLFDHRGVKQPYGSAVKAGLQLNSVIFPQLLTQMSQPTLGIPQTIQQRYV